MNGGFSRHRRSGACVATFTSYEADRIRMLEASLIELLRNEAAAPGTLDPLEELLDFTGPTRPPEDPILARLFPTAYRDDEEAAAEFRRYTEGTLRNGKASAAASVIDTLEEAGLPDSPEDGVFIDVELDPAQAITWMRSLTDIRLAIATGLGIENEEDEQDRWRMLEDDDPAAWMYAMYQWVGFLLETLVEAAS